MLRLCAVAGVGEHEKCCIGEVVFEDDGVDRVDDDVFGAVNDQGWLPDRAEHGVAVRARDFAPVTDRMQLGGGGRGGDRRIAVRGTPVEAVQICAPRGLAGVAGREERVHEQGRRVVEFLCR